jgi:peroxiredoxin
MGSALLVGRLLLACVFAVAGIAKLADLAGSRRAVANFGVPERFAGVAGAGLPLLELAVAVALLVSAAARFGALGALVLLVMFVVAITVAMIRGNEADCHCFGQLHSAPVGWRTLLRNVALAAVAAFVAVEGWHSSGVSATAWIGRLSAGWAVAAGLAVVLVGVVGFVVWFSLQLLVQNGRVLARLDAIETVFSDAGDALPVEVALGAGLRGGGRAVGSPAPDFELPALDGGTRSLASLLSAGRQLMLVFSDAGCGPCSALLPEVAAWQREHRRQLEIALVASGGEQANREKTNGIDVQHVLIEAEREVSSAYQAHGTPSAVVIGADRLIKSPLVGGADAVRTLVSQATQSPVLVRRVNGANGQRNGAAPAERPPPDTSRVGQPAPDLELVHIEGQPVALRDVLEQSTVAIFWNPGCGFCQRMLSDLKAFETNQPEGSPQLLLIATGDPERTREQQFRSPVLIDSGSQAGRAFNAGGTPMGVFIQDGLIASPVAAGADAVFQLIRNHTHTPALAGSHANGTDGAR